MNKEARFGFIVTIRFSKKFHIRTIFSKIKKALKIWGNPIVCGPAKMQIYGVDTRFWKPVILEITDRHLVIISGCNNTIQRFVRFIEKNVDSMAKIFIGDRRIK